MAAYLRKGETYSDLAIGFAIGTTTVFRYIREALDGRAALALRCGKRSALQRARRS